MDLSGAQERVPLALGVMHFCRLQVRGIRSGAFWLRRRDAARPARADGEAAGGAVDFHFSFPSGLAGPAAHET